MEVGFFRDLRWWQTRPRRLVVLRAVALQPRARRRWCRWGPRRTRPAVECGCSGGTRACRLGFAPRSPPAGLAISKSGPTCPPTQSQEDPKVERGRLMPHIESDKRFIASDVAHTLFECELRGDTVGPERLGTICSEEVGYEVQWLGRRLREESGGRCIGYKIGLATESARVAMGGDEPGYGHLFDYMVKRPDAVVTVRRPGQYAVEAEVAVVTSADLGRERITEESAAAAVRDVTVAVEIVSSRLTGGPPGRGLWVADNASAALAVVGHPVRMSLEPKQRWMGELRVNAGRAVSAELSPARSLAWLANKLHTRSSVLPAGSLVLTGALCGPVTVMGGDSVRAEVGELGDVGVVFRRGSGSRVWPDGYARTVRDRARRRSG